MKKKKYSALSMWQRVDFAVNRYDSLNGNTAMGGVSSLTSEIDRLKDLIKYTENCQLDFIKYQHDMPIIEEVQKLDKWIATKRKDQGFLKSIFGNNDELFPYLEKLQQLRAKIQGNYGYDLSYKPQFGSTTSLLDLKEIVKKLNDYSKILKASIEKARIRAKQREVTAIESKQRKEMKLARQEAEKQRLIALAAAHTGNSRRRATSIKQQLIDQIKYLPCCPYCGGELGDSPHADHIYPIARGGLSTVENMVYVCQICNKKKSDKTIVEFIQSSMFYDLNTVINNLSLLKKKI